MRNYFAASFLVYILFTILPAALLVNGENSKSCLLTEKNVTVTCHANASCIRFNESSSCSCQVGFSGNGTDCYNINECIFNNTCPANSTCVDSNGSFSCTCMDGYAWNGSICSDVNECKNGANRCHINALCQNTVGSYSCKCPIGYQGNGSVCEDMNECSNVTHPCSDQSSCINTIGSFYCTCETGFTGNIPNCSNINECLLNDTCNDNATCIDTPGSFACNCKSGFTGNGSFCGDIDECKNSSVCTGIGEACRNVPGSYECICDVGFTRNATRSCVDINECLIGAHNCSSNSECVNMVGSYICNCKQGYTGNGSYCVDICKVVEHLCHSNATCATINGAHNCTCKPGFTGNGTFCKNRNECSEKNDCSSSAECIDTEGSYICRCRKGYSGNGTNCFDQDECIMHPPPCRSFLACINTVGSYECLNHCQGSLCPDMAVCQNTAKSHLCRCIGGLFKSNGICRKSKTIFRVSNFVLKGEYLANYGDARSSAFTRIATVLESNLLNVLRSTSIGSGLRSVKVFKLEKGSVVVFYYLLYAERQELTADQVKAVVANHSLFLSLRPDVSKIPTVRVTNLCETGGHGCDKKASCVPSDSGYSYTCKCKLKYEMRNGKCRKKRSYALIIIPAVIGGLLFIFFTFLLIALLCKRRQVRKTEQKERLRYEVHIEQIHMEPGHDNVTMKDYS